ncbi:19491_t:CDS:2, partial [Gigaspora margarita]
KSDLDDDDEDAERLNCGKKIKRVPSVPSLTLYDKGIAENVLEIRKAHHCSMHNWPCFNRENHRDLHFEITFRMLSIWASDMNKGLATIEAPPMHLLFSHANILSKKLSKVTSLLSSSPSPTVQLLPPQTSLSHLQTQVPLVLPPSQMQAPLILPSQAHNWMFGSQMLQPHHPLFSTHIIHIKIYLFKLRLVNLIHTSPRFTYNGRVFERSRPSA